ncbi:19502_t:CDS:2, partial [Dentiscutata erythropus]
MEKDRGKCKQHPAFQASWILMPYLQQGSNVQLNCGKVDDDDGLNNKIKPIYNEPFNDSVERIPSDLTDGSLPNISEIL